MDCVAVRVSFILVKVWVVWVWWASSSCTKLNTKQSNTV